MNRTGYEGKAEDKVTICTNSCALEQEQGSLIEEREGFERKHT